MKRNQKTSSIKLTEKFDNQLRDILNAELRSVRYKKNRMMEQFIFQVNNEPLSMAL